MYFSVAHMLIPTTSASQRDESAAEIVVIRIMLLHIKYARTNNFSISKRRLDH